MQYRYVEDESGDVGNIFGMLAEEDCNCKAFCSTAVSLVDVGSFWKRSAPIGTQPDTSIVL